MTTIPSFLKQEPKVPNILPPSTNPQSPVEAANALGESVRKLISERDTLREELDFQRKMIETLNAKLEVADRDATHYRGKAAYFERFSMTIAANFNVIRSIIDDTQRKANELAQKDDAKTEAPIPAPMSEAPADPISRVSDALSDILHNGNANGEPK